jgi:hypothetical protein
MYLKPLDYGEKRLVAEFAEENYPEIDIGLFVIDNAVYCNEAL